MKNRSNVRKVPLFFVVLLLTIPLFNFQNCSMPPESAAYSGQDGETHVAIVDDLVKNKLAFVEDERTVSINSPSVNLDGLCDRKSTEMLEWELTSENGDEVFAFGVSQCSYGGFRVKVLDLDQLECEATYNIVVMGDDEKFDEVKLSLDCQ